MIAISGRSRASQVDTLEGIPPARPIVVAAQGLVEPISEEIEVASEMSGKLTAVLVEEGDRVQRGQLIAILNNADHRAQVASAEARLRQKAAELRRVLNGARQQERHEAREVLKEAEVIQENARAEMERRHQLYGQKAVSREEAERAQREYNVAKARAEAMSQRHSLINAPAREEDRSKAEAEAELEQARLDEARAQLEKTFIRSPLSGVILRKHVQVGETVSSWLGARPMPIVTVADISTLRVRVDVDEADVGKIALGQRAYVMARAYGSEKFWGRVVRIGQILGKKNFRTGEPTERVDAKILETLIELDDGRGVYPGLRVDTFIIVTEEPAAAIRPLDQQRRSVVMADSTRLGALFDELFGRN